VDFAFSTDQDQLRDAARRLLAERLPAPRLHELADGGAADLALWAELADLGWVGMSAPDGGGSFLDEAVVLEEAGLALAPVPVLSATIGLPALVAVGADPAAPSAVAWGELGGEPRAGQPVAEATGSAWALTGVVGFVPDLGAARQVVVVAAARGSGPAAFVVDAAHPGVCVDAVATVDGTRPVARLRLEDAPARQAVPGAVLSRLRWRAEAGLAVESVGVAQRALELAAAHATDRVQFGRAIGTYQAVAHRVADVYVQTELARSLAYRAAWCVTAAEAAQAGDDPVVEFEVDLACAAAKAAATDAAVGACESLIQVLGGIGMTWEHVAHRYYKRALGNQVYGGRPSVHRARLAAALLDS
jgi:alkylation response protein AidB-like acyl-CoA dehydrogenase